MNLDDAKPRAARAYKRRFGASVLALHFKVTDREAQHLRLFDPESGSSMEFDYSGWRLRRIGEHDGMSQMEAG